MCGVFLVTVTRLGVSPASAVVAVDTTPCVDIVVCRIVFVARSVVVARDVVDWPEVPGVILVPPCPFAAELPTETLLVTSICLAVVVGECEPVVLKLAAILAVTATELGRPWDTLVGFSISISDTVVVLSSIGDVVLADSLSVSPIADSSVYASSLDVVASIDPSVIMAAVASPISEAVVIPSSTVSPACTDSSSVVDSVCVFSSGTSSVSKDVVAAPSIGSSDTSAAVSSAVPATVVIPSITVSSTFADSSSVVDGVFVSPRDVASVSCAVVLMDVVASFGSFVAMCIVTSLTVPAVCENPGFVVDGDVMWVVVVGDVDAVVSSVVVVGVITATNKTGDNDDDNKM